MPFLHSTLVRHHPQTLELFLEKKKPLSLIFFELLAASCIECGISIIMIHEDSMHTLHTNDFDNSRHKM